MKVKHKIEGTTLTEAQRTQGGVISDPKQFVADFLIMLREKTMNFWKKGGDGGHSNPKEFVADFSTSRKKAQHCFPKLKDI